VLTDRDESGAHEGPFPMQLEADTNKGYIFGGEVWTSANDGAGSGLDADLLDGIGSASFLRSDVSGSVAVGRKISFYSNAAIESTASDQATLEVFQTTVGADAFMQFHVGGDHATYFGLDGSTNDLAVGGWSKGANKYKIFHEGNSTAFTSADHTKLNGIETSATADQTAAQILAKLKTVDVNGTAGVNAGTFDGLDSSKYLRSDGFDQFSGLTGTDLTVTGSAMISNTAPSLRLNDTTTGADDFWLHANSNNFYVLADRDDNGSHETPHPLQLEADTNKGYIFGGEVWTSANDGAGSGLDADLLDGLGSGSFLRSNAPDTFTSQLILSGTSDVTLTSTAHPFQLGVSSALNIAMDNNEIQARSNGSASTLNVQLEGGATTFGGNIVINGAGTVDGRDVSVDGTKLDGIETGATADQTAAQLLAKIKTVDVNGSGGINAGRLDGHALASAATGSTVVERTASGDINARLFRSSYASTSSNCAHFMTQVNQGTDNYLRPSTAAQARTKIVAGAAAGSVGSYAWCLLELTNLRVVFGSNYSGSQLIPAGITATAWGVTSNNYTFDDEGGDLNLGPGTSRANLSGQWRCMGMTGGGSSTSYDYPSTLFLRTS
jgi:hypothetical protein